MPLHLTRSLTRYRLLRRRDRLAAARAVLALRRLDPADPALDRRSFGEWLEARGQSVAAVEALWDLVGVATLNAGAADASLSLAATVFQVGLLTASDAADLGWSLVPLQRLHGEAAEAALRRAGVDHRRSTRVRELRPTGDAWWVGTDTGGLQAAAVVVAVEPAQAERLLPADALDLPAGWSARLGETPIVNVHAIFDRPVMREPFLACAGSPLQWLFDRTVPAGLRGGGQYLAASISAATAVADRPVARLRAELIPELERVLPAARQAELRDFFVTREPHATFRQSPDSARWRPSATTRHRGLVLAGAHTATGWPATMEGAVRSGVTAAEALLATTPARQREGVAA